MQQVTEGSQAQLTQLQSDVKDTENNILTEVMSISDQHTEGRQQFHTDMADIRDLVHVTRLGQDSVITAVTAMQHESSRTRAEVASVRDLLLDFITGNLSSIAPNRPNTSRLTGRDNADLASEVGNQLI